jgi:hypothetical protein
MRHARGERPGWDPEPVELEEPEPTPIAPVAARQRARCYARGFPAAKCPTVGLEEELIVAEPELLLPVNETASTRTGT